MKPQGLKILATLIVGLCTASPSALAGGAGKVCTKDFKTASKYFQDILGEDASLDRIPAFAGEYSLAIGKLNAENTIKDGGGPVFLETKLSMKMGKLAVPFGHPINAPVEICKTNGKLTATLIMSSAVIKNPAGEKPVKDSMKDVPDQIIIGVSRNEKKEVVFKSETYPNQPAAAVTVR